MSTEGTATDAAMPRPVDPGLVIACELPCIHCGYDLRTMRLEGQCPECGKACAESLGGLAAARREDLARLRWGVVMMMAAALIPMFVVGFVIAGLLVESIWPGTMTWIDDDAYPWMVGLPLAVIGPVVALAGVFRVTSLVRPAVESGLPSSQPGHWARRLLRWMGCVYAAASVGGFACMTLVMEVGWFDGWEALMWCMVITAAVTAHAWTARNVLMCRYLATMMRLSDAPKLARWLRVLSLFAILTLMYVVLICGVVLLIYLFRDWLENMDPNGSRVWSGVFFMTGSVVNSVGSLGMLGWSIAWPISLLLVVRRVRAIERVVAARGGPIVRVAERPAGG